MKIFKSLKLITAFYAIVNLMAISACSQRNSQTEIKTNKTGKHVGGPCEGCEAIFESPVPFTKLSWTDTLPDFNESGPKLMIRGTVYHNDYKTPAKDVVLYVYHTGQDGKYTNKYKAKGWGARHGYIRGWMKTNDLGQYRFYTLLPASYPNSKALKHIHPVIKEPGENEYYIDEYLFDIDPFLTKGEKRKKHGERGGNGIVTLTQEGGLYVGERDIFLGKNIPGYPVAVQ